MTELDTRCAPLPTHAGGYSVGIVSFDEKIDWIWKYVVKILTFSAPTSAHSAATILTCFIVCSFALSTEDFVFLIFDLFSSSFSSSSSSSPAGATLAGSSPPPQHNALSFLRITTIATTSASSTAPVCTQGAQQAMCATSIAKLCAGYF